MGFIPRFQENKVKIDYSRCKEVAVIATFAPGGKYKPLYFLIKDDYGNDCKTKITNIRDSKEDKGYTTFFCVYQVGSMQRECTLIFYINEHLWVLENSLTN